MTHSTEPVLAASACQPDPAAHTAWVLKVKDLRLAGHTLDEARAIAGPMPGSGREPSYWVDPRPGEPVGAWAIRLAARYQHDTAVAELTRALQRERLAQDLLTQSHDITAASDQEAQR